jgi:hypothetical protein
MTNYQPSDLGLLLNEIAQALDIPDSLADAAEKKYQAVGTWLGANDSPLAPYAPHIYPQGSFRLGTVIKPISNPDDYDIDLVAELALRKNQLSQKELKNMVGDRLKAHEIYRQMLDEEGDRCWTLQYANSAHFHMDILPAIPDREITPILEARGVPLRLAQTGIAITDKKRDNYARIDTDWLRGNPSGYASWFREQMIVRYEEIRKSFAEARKAQVDHVPEYQIKTPLQRSIQLLKRHRDIQFTADPENKPASIILTTLAARAYRNEADLLQAFIHIIDGMPGYLTVKNGVTWVENPVDPAENFADRWQGHPQREPKFKTWLIRVRHDLIALQACDNIDAVGQLLVAFFGEKIASTVVSQYKESTKAPEIPNRSALVSIPPLVTIRNPNKPWGR